MTWPAAVQAYFDQNKPVRHEWLFWCRVKEFDTNTEIDHGIWTGILDETILVDGLNRLYQAASKNMAIDSPHYRIGTNITTQRLSIVLTPEGEAMVRGYNTVMAPCLLHSRVYDADTNEPLGNRRFFKGFIAGANISEGNKQEPSVITIELMSLGAMGTKTVNGKKSNASQKLRDPNDEIRSYQDLKQVTADTWHIVDA